MYCIFLSIVVLHHVAWVLVGKHLNQHAKTQRSDDVDRAAVGSNKAMVSLCTCYRQILSVTGTFFLKLPLARVLLLFGHECVAGSGSFPDGFDQRLRRQKY